MNKFQSILVAAMLVCSVSAFAAGKAKAEKMDCAAMADGAEKTACEAKMKKHAGAHGKAAAAKKDAPAATETAPATTEAK